MPLLIWANMQDKVWGATGLAAASHHLPHCTPASLLVTCRYLPFPARRLLHARLCWHIALRVCPCQDDALSADEVARWLGLPGSEPRGTTPLAQALALLLAAQRALAEALRADALATQHPHAQLPLSPLGGAIAALPAHSLKRIASFLECARPPWLPLQQRQQARVFPLIARLPPEHQRTGHSPSQLQQLHDAGVAWLESAVRAHRRDGAPPTRR